LGGLVEGGWLSGNCVGKKGLRGGNAKVAPCGEEPNRERSKEGHASPPAEGKTGRGFSKRKRKNWAGLAKGEGNTRQAAKGRKFQSCLKQKEGKRKKKRGKIQGNSIKRKGKKTMGRCQPS